MARLFQRSKKLSRESGAAMIEMTMVVPLMLLFIGGLLELGRLFNQLAWAQRSVYEAAYLGSFSPENSRSLAVADRLNLLVALHRNDFLPDFSATEERIDDRAFSVQLVAGRSRLTAIPNAMNLTLNSSMKSPALYPNQGDTNLRSFRNGSDFRPQDATCALDPSQCEAAYSASCAGYPADGDCPYALKYGQNYVPRA